MVNFVERSISIEIVCIARQTYEKKGTNTTKHRVNAYISKIYSLNSSMKCATMTCYFGIGWGIFGYSSYFLIVFNRSRRSLQSKVSLHRTKNFRISKLYSQESFIFGWRFGLVWFSFVLFCFFFLTVFFFA